MGGKRGQAHVLAKRGLLIRKGREKPVYGHFLPICDHMELTNVYFSRIA